ncbi:MAG: type II toxin-antitoxin system ParD family antitoxin [Planctomycetaceae bacterium]|nr:type II toxin-antitoxin system ParD family antitoxin [Planctomycetaceae bacterium]
MTTVNVSLPKALHGFVEKRTKAGGYEDASEYFRALVREDQRRLRDLERKILEGLNSGERIEVNKEYWEKKKTALKAKFAKKKSRS